MVSGVDSGNQESSAGSHFATIRCLSVFTTEHTVESLKRWTCRADFCLWGERSSLLTSEQVPRGESRKKGKTNNYLWFGDLKWEVVHLVSSKRCRKYCLALRGLLYNTLRFLCLTSYPGPNPLSLLKRKETLRHHERIKSAQIIQII